VTRHSRLVEEEEEEEAGEGDGRIPMECRDAATYGLSIEYSSQVIDHHSSWLYSVVQFA